MADKIRIACIGDSITFGFGVMETAERDSYPAILQDILGGEYQVTNYGLCGRTLLLSGDTPYVREEEYRKTFWNKPDYYICMLGTNDAKPYNWDPEGYEKELKVFLQKYTNYVGTERVLFLKPPKCFAEDGNREAAYHVMDENVKALGPIIDRVAKSLGVSVLDLYSPTCDHPEWFADGVHPNVLGNRFMAQAVAQKIGRPGFYRANDSAKGE